MYKEKNFKKNFIWNIIGLTLNSFLSLFLLIVVKWINGANIAGIFTYSFSAAMLFFIVSNYYNRTYQVSNYDSNKNFNHYLSVRILFSLVTLLLCILFLMINRFGLEKNATVLLLVVFKIIESIADCFFAFFQLKEDLYKSGISYSLKSILGLLIFSIVDLLTKNIIISLCTINILDLIILYFYDYRQYKKYTTDKIKMNFKMLTTILKEAFPIFIFSFFSIYISNMQKYILTYYVDNELQMIFGILIMPATVMSLISTYLVLPFVNKFKLYYKYNDKKSFISLSIKINVILLICGLLCISIAYFIGIPVLNLIYNVKIDEYLYMLLILLLGAIFNGICIVLSNILIIMKKNGIQLIPYISASSLGTILTAIFIKSNGLYGAGYSFLITSLIILIAFIIIYLMALNSWKGNENL